MRREKAAGNTLLEWRRGGSVMEKVYFQPWVGSEYEKSRLLILGGSAYGWKAGMKLEPSHPRVQVQHWMENFEGRGRKSSASSGQSVGPFVEKRLPEAMTNWNRRGANAAPTRYFCSESRGIWGEEPTDAQWEARQVSLSRDIKKRESSAQQSRSDRNDDVEQQVSPFRRPSPL